MDKQQLESLAAIAGGRIMHLEDQTEVVCFRPGALPLFVELIGKECERAVEQKVHVLFDDKQCCEGYVDEAIKAIKMTCERT